MSKHHMRLMLIAWLFFVTGIIMLSGCQPEEEKWTAEDQRKHLQVITPDPPPVYSHPAQVVTTPTAQTSSPPQVRLALKIYATEVANHLQQWQSVALDFAAYNKQVVDDPYIVNEENWKVGVLKDMALMVVVTEQMRDITPLPTEAYQIHAVLIEFASEVLAMCQDYVQALKYGSEADWRSAVNHANRLDGIMGELAQAGEQMERTYFPNDFRFNELSNRTTEVQKRYRVITEQAQTPAQPNFVVH